MKDNNPFSYQGANSAGFGNNIPMPNQVNPQGNQLQSNFTNPNPLQQGLLNYQMGMDQPFRNPAAGQQQQQPIGLQRTSFDPNQPSNIWNSNNQGLPTKVQPMQMMQKQEPNSPTVQTKQPQNADQEQFPVSAEVNEDDDDGGSDSDSSVSCASNEAPQAWEQKHDRILTKYAQQTGNNWKKVAKEFVDFKVTPKYCKYRYKQINSGQSSSTKTRFTHYEDLTIVKYYKKFGSNWDQIAKNLVNRTPSMVKNRFYSNIKKKGKVEAFLAEVEKLQVAPEELLRKDKTKDVTNIGEQGDDSSKPVNAPQAFNYGGHQGGDGMNNQASANEFAAQNMMNFQPDIGFASMDGMNENFYQPGVDPNQADGNHVPKANVQPEEFLKKKTQDKINMLRSKVSNIQNLFEQTKFEIQKIQNLFKIDN